MMKHGFVQQASGQAYSASSIKAMLTDRGHSDKRDL
jgi:hypothetical protein